MLGKTQSITTHEATGGDTLVDTVNNRGFIHPLSSVSRDFVAFGEHAPGWMLDVGSGTGVATLPALTTGAGVIALDMEETHLKVLREMTPERYLPRLRTVTGHFPEALEDIDEPLGAVLISQILGFLSGDEIMMGFQYLFEKMTSGAKLFVINYTPYITLTAEFISVYERRCGEQDPWPGLISELRDYCTNPRLLYNLPNTLNLMDPTILAREAIRAGFNLEQASFLGGVQVPERFRLDGREWACMIASKP